VNNSAKSQKIANYLENNRFEVIFDEFSEGNAIEELMKFAKNGKFQGSFF